MTTTTPIATTPVPQKAEGQTWDDYTQAILDACEAEETRLLQEFPTPEIAGTPGSDEWTDTYYKQRAVAEQRRSILHKLQARTIVAIAEAIEREVPSFEALEIEYAGEGDSGTDSDISIAVAYGPFLDAEGKWRPLTQEEKDAYEAAREAANALLPAELTEWLDETGWALAYEKHPGFETNEGGYGTISATREEEGGPMELSITHNQRSVETYSDSLI